MDARNFDTLLRSLSQTRSRRLAVQLLTGAVLGGLLGRGARQEMDAHDKLKKCKKVEDKQKKKRCVRKAKKHNATHTTQGTPAPPNCANLTDDAACDGGKCLQGVCNPTPICTHGGTACTTDAQCCSGHCGGENVDCQRGPAGGVCIDGDDCLSGVCTGHRCVDTGCIYNNDYCIGGVGNCHGGGFCLVPLGGGGPRCGNDTGVQGICNCASHQECVDILGAGAFCAQDTGGSCSCNGAPTFCVGPA